MGYTPLFSSLTTGTLCGKWPDIGLWPVVLSMADRHGIVDVTPSYIAGVTGLALTEVIACMKRFCEPDPYSRTRDHDGARLELLEAHRDWGWRVVNHAKYAEKARKINYDSHRVASGEDAARKAKERSEAKRGVSRDVPTCPDVSRAVPLSGSGSGSGLTKNSPSRSSQSQTPSSYSPQAIQEPLKRLSGRLRGGAGG